MENDKKHMRFLASCFAMVGLLESYQDPEEFTVEHMADVAVECADALVARLDDEDEDKGIASVVKRKRKASAQ
jgi:hypothetical protein